MTVVVLGQVLVREGQLDEALALSLEHVRRSRGEPGCISHGVHQDAEQPRRLVFAEEWQDLSALHEHFRVPASRAFGKALAGLAEQPPTLTVYEAKAVAL